MDLFVIDTCRAPPRAPAIFLGRVRRGFDRKSKEAGKSIILLEKMPPAGQSDAASLEVLNQVLRNLNQTFTT
jgi:hypothetical protein